MHHRILSIRMGSSQNWNRSTKMAGHVLFGAPFKYQAKGDHPSEKDLRIFSALKHNNISNFRGDPTKLCSEANSESQWSLS